MSMSVCARESVSVGVHGPHKMSPMLTWLWRPGLEGTKGHDILQSQPTLAPFFPSFWAWHK